MSVQPPARPSLFYRVVTLGALVYLLLMLLYAFNRFIIQDRFWVVSLLNSFALLVFVPLPMLLVLALVARSRRAALYLLPITLWALVWFVPRFLPKLVPALAENTPVLRVMTNNISHFNQSPERVPAVTLEQNPDIIFLQEVELANSQSALSQLDAAYPYKTIQDDAMRVGMYTAVNITYSRLPFISSKQIEPLIIGMPLIYRNVIELSGQPVALYNIHLLSPGGGGRLTNRINNYFLRYALDYDDTLRNFQVDELLAYLATEPYPYIVAGDFNTSDFSMTYTRLAAQMHDSFAESAVGFGGSWPAARALGLPAFVPPLIRIDYIWHSAGLRTQRAWEGEFTGSDHLPMFADFTIRPN